MAGATTSVANKNFSAEKPRPLPPPAPPTAPPRLAFAALLLGSAMLALGPLFVRLADTGPVAAGFWRLALALPILLLLARREVRVSGRTPLARPLLLIALGAGLFFAADLASWHVGIHMTKMANATLFGNSASIILAVWAIAIARRWPVWSEASAVVLAVTGAALLMGESYEASRANLIGDLFCLLAGILYAGYMLSMQRVRGSVGPWETLSLATAAGCVPLLITAWLLNEAILPVNWTPVLLLALSSQVIGQGLLVYALPHFSALVVGLSLLVQPAFAALIGWGVYGERLTLAEMAGGVLVAAALVLARLPAAAPSR
jgi:drug/metabolite transporter (DMT)-like permease